MGLLAFEKNVSSVLWNTEHNGSNLHFEVKRKKAMYVTQRENTKKELLQQLRKSLGKRVFRFERVSSYFFPLLERITPFFFFLTSIHI